MMWALMNSLGWSTAGNSLLSSGYRVCPKWFIMSWSDMLVICNLQWALVKIVKISPPSAQQVMTAHVECVIYIF